MGTDLPLFPSPIYFDGETYDPEYDRDRLKKLLGRVYQFMRAV